MIIDFNMRILRKQTKREYLVQQGNLCVFYFSKKKRGDKYLKTRNTRKRINRIIIIIIIIKGKKNQQQLYTLSSSFFPFFLFISMKLFYSFTVRCDNFNVSFPIAGFVRSTRIIFNGLLSNVDES
jgi:hypothetical protein